MSIGTNHSLVTLLCLWELEHAGHLWSWPHVHTDPGAALKAMSHLEEWRHEAITALTGLLPFTQAFTHTSKTHAVTHMAGDILTIHNMFALGVKFYRTLRFLKAAQLVYFIPPCLGIAQVWKRWYIDVLSIWNLVGNNGCLLEIMVPLIENITFLSYFRVNILNNHQNT